MRILLDTHVFLWAAVSDSRLSPRAKPVLASKDVQLWLSVASLWETTIKFQIGKLKLPTRVEDFIERQISETEIAILPISPNHVRTLSTIPLLHRDPFDRMLVAQSIAERLPLMSADKAISRYPVEVIW